MRSLIGRILCVLLLLAGAAGTLGVTARGAPEGTALLVEIDGAIGPATVKLLENALEAAEQRDAGLVILRMDTPGGLSESMRTMIRAILSSSIPVATYVAPSGARAASAGTYILYASHLAVMAPGTNLGAATPVQIGGGLPLPGGEPEPGDRAPDKTDAPAGEQQDGEEEAEPVPPPGDAMGRKMVNDAVAYIRGLAELHGRDADWAERAVREGVSLPAREAAERGVVDFVAGSVEGLLDQADGRTVMLGERSTTLATAGLAVERFEPSWQVELLQVITNPNTAFILLMIGVYGLIFEFANPGSIGPGIIGAICLLLGLYALDQLPLDYTGFGLILLGVALMIAEAVTPTFGVLGAGGIVAFLIGAIFLIDSDSPQFQLSWWTIGSVTAITGALLTLLLGYVWRVHRRPVVTGDVEMLGHDVRVLTWSGSSGEVLARGERWRARCAESLTPGEMVTVDGIEGLTLAVSRHAPRAGRPDQGEC
jgi:membrane-bound serine protease (ClpP class)